MAVAGQTPSEIHLNSSTPAAPAGASAVKFQAGNPYPDPNNPALSVRDVTAYVAPSYAADSGSVNAYAVNLSPAQTGLAAGMQVVFVAANSNTGPSTLNINGLGARTVYKLNGSTDLAAGDIVGGQVVTVVYDGTNFQLQSPAAAAASVPALAKGGIITSGGSGLVALPAGSDGQVLTVDSTQSDGIKWSTPTSGGGSSIVPFIYQSAINTGMACTFPFAVRSGDLLVAALNWSASSNSGITISDILGNAWTQAFNIGTSATTFLTVFYSLATHAGSDTVTFAHSGTSYTICEVAEFLNAGGGLDVQGGGTIGQMNCLLTTTQSYDLVLSIMGGSHTSTTFPVAGPSQSILFLNGSDAAGMAYVVPPYAGSVILNVGGGSSQTDAYLVGLAFKHS